MAFTDVARCKRMLRIPVATTTHDALLADLVAQANAEILNVLLLNSDAVTAYSDLFDIERAGENEVMLRHSQVLTLTQVLDADEVVPSTDYYFNRTGSVRLIPTWKFFTQGRQTVQVDYTAGFATVPDDLKGAATELVAYTFNHSRHAGFKSERIGQYSYELGDTSGSAGVAGSAVLIWPPTTQRVLGNYRRVFPPE